MVNRNIAKTSRELPVFLRGVYFRHYEDLVENTKNEDNDLRYVAEQAGRTGISYLNRINNISGKLSVLDLNDSLKREYVLEVLNSMQKGLNENIKRSVARGENRLTSLIEAKNRLSGIYEAISELNVKTNEEYKRAKTITSPIAPQISLLDYSQRSVETRSIPSSEGQYSLKVNTPLAPASLESSVVKLDVSRHASFSKRLARASGLMTLFVVGAIAASSFFSGCKKQKDGAINTLSDQTQKASSVADNTQTVSSFSQSQLANQTLIESNAVLLAEKNKFILKSETLAAEFNSYKNTAENRINQFVKTYSQISNQVTELQSDISVLSSNYALVVNSLTKSNESLRTELNSFKTNQDAKIGQGLNIDLDTNVVTSVNIPFDYDSPSSPSKKGFIQKVADDVDLYRQYSLKEGSISFSKSAKKASQSLGNAANSFGGLMTLCYGPKSFESVTKDDLSFKKPAKELSHSAISFIKRLGGPLTDKGAYKGLNPLTGAITWPGRIITGTYTFGKDTANLATAGLANNIIDSGESTLTGLIETGKHTLEAGLNSSRIVTKPLPKKYEKFANKFMDWPINTLPEWASNVLEGEGFGNAQNMRQSVIDKGNFGVVAEFGADGFLVYKSVKEITENDEISNGNNNSSGGGRVDDPGVGVGGGQRVSAPGVK